MSSFQQAWNGLFIPSYQEVAEEPFIGPLSAEQHAIQIDGLAYFEREPEVRCLWQFNEAHGETPGSTFEPGVNRVPGTDYFVVSPFAPGRIIIHSPIALRAGTFNFGVSHGVLFDSNLYSRITGFVESPNTLSAADREATRRLIETIVARRYDFQMLPYIVESFCVNSPSKGHRYAQQATKAILRLHLMDKQLFLASGTIGVDHGRLDKYRESFGTTDLDEIVEAQLEPYKVFTKMPGEVNLWLCSLIMMVLIRRVELPNKPISKQFEAFDEYMFERLRMFAGKHHFMALFYFGGLLDSWVKVQRNSVGTRALELLINSAWDLYLGRLPDQILAGSPENQPSLTYFCTRERELANYLASSQTYMLRVMKHGGFRAFDSYDNELLLKTAGTDAVNVLSDAHMRADQFLSKRSGGSIERISWDEVNHLTSEMTARFLASLPAN